jgi:hypothetical protein
MNTHKISLMNINIAYNKQEKLLRSIRIWIKLFIVALVASGLTALGVETQMYYLSAFFPSQTTIVGGWLWEVYAAVKDTNQRYPFIAYGFDWLAFAHLVIALVFIGPLRDPVRNKWVIQFGRIACCMVIPFALLASAYRGLPLWWSAIDCSFGIIGLIPLSICLKLINRLEKSQASARQPFPSSEPLKNEVRYESVRFNA